MNYFPRRNHQLTYINVELHEKQMLFDFDYCSLYTISIAYRNTSK